MDNLRLRDAAPTSVDVTVDQRGREYLTDREVERLIEAAKQNRSGHRDATAIRSSGATLLGVVPLFAGHLTLGALFAVVKAVASRILSNGCGFPGFIGLGPQFTRP
jgi:hypothetical protein